jgi:hypothetical protein
MKKTLPVLLLMIVLVINACAPLKPVPRVPVGPQNPTQAGHPGDQKVYLNSAFGLTFQYPSSWFGPDEYFSGQTLRLAIGTDKITPYGEPPDQAAQVNNSYQVVIQFTKNDQNQSWMNTYQSLASLKDGESLSGARSLIIRVRQLDLGKFKGFEYISTLSERAQTDHVYAREVILVDDASNSLSISGQPTNVEVSEAAKWRDEYRTIDEANLDLFHEILDSISIK